MPAIEVNLYDLAVFLEDEGGDARESSLEWGRRHGVPQSHIDYIWQQFGTHDARKFIGMCHDASSILIDLTPNQASDAHDWMIPESYPPIDPDRKYTQFLVSRPQPRSSQYVHTKDGELLVPAPYGAKPAKLIRHGWHFLLGLESAMPCLCGCVEELQPMSADQFRDLVVASSWTRFRSCRSVNLAQ
jgi:hypothetical protein